MSSYNKFCNMSLSSSYANRINYIHYLNELEIIPINIASQYINIATFNQTLIDAVRVFFEFDFKTAQVGFSKTFRFLLNSETYLSADFSLSIEKIDAANFKAKIGLNTNTFVYATINDEYVLNSTVPERIIPFTNTNQLVNNNKFSIFVELYRFPLSIVNVSVNSDIYDVNQTQKYITFTVESLTLNYQDVNINKVGINDFCI